MQLKKLPIGIQTFSDIRKDDYVYVDKTDIAYNLIESYRYVFLARPRRFGKSLFLDTLKNIFEGNKELFKGLAIEDKWNWDTSYPVLNISFEKGKIESRTDLDEAIIRTLRNNQVALKIECEEKHSVAGCFEELILKAYEKYNQKVVILVDEYDKPILDNISEPEIAKSVRDGLVNFYSVIKGSDEYIKFAFLTGVSKFTKTSLFSGLNNLKDISLKKQYGDICGYTQNDIETTFKPYLEGVNMQELKSWYNGYNFLGSDMYNPFDILQFIDNEFEYSNYWFETGTPTFLIELMKENDYFLPNLSDIRANDKLLSSFDINNLDFEVVLYQSGYLTIDKVEKTIFGTQEYLLKVPNKEVKQSLSDIIIIDLYQDKKLMVNKTALYKSLLENNMDNFKNSLSSMFASIPYNNYTNNDISSFEGFYSSVIYIYLQSLGFHITGEDVTNKGRIDLTIIMDNAIYIIEFKVDSKQNALEQIKEKKYYEKYLNNNKDIYLVGITFDTNEKNISNFEWEKHQAI